MAENRCREVCVPHVRKKAPGKRGSQGGKGRQSFPGANGLLKRVAFRFVCARRAAICLRRWGENSKPLRSRSVHSLQQRW